MLASIFMKNSYPFFNRYKEKLPLVAFAIQEPDYTYINPKTGKHFTVKEIYDFANNYLGASILFWNIQQPQYTKEVLPFLNNINRNEHSADVLVMKIQTRMNSK